MHTQPSNGARCLIFGQTLRLAPSCVQTVKALARLCECECDKYHNLMSWLINDKFLSLCQITLKHKSNEGTLYFSSFFKRFTAESKSGCADSVDCNTADVEMMSVEEINISTVQDKNKEIPNADGDNGGMIADASDLQKEEFSLVTMEEKSKLLLKNIDILETLSAVCARIDIVKIVTKYLGEYLCVSKGEWVYCKHWYTCNYCCNNSEI